MAIMKVIGSDDKFIQSYVMRATNNANTVIDTLSSF
jgi:hypothetical protein